MSDEPDTSSSPEQAQPGQPAPAASTGAGEDSFTFSWKHFFSEIFVPHKPGAIEERLSWGMPGRIPRIEDVSLEFPRPWLFVRIALLGILGFILLQLSFKQTNNLILVPGLIFFGCFVIPCSILILFFEINALRDISIVRAFGAFLCGAVLSLVITPFFNSGASSMGLSWLSASVAGLTEEPAKLIAAYFLLRLAPRKTIFAGLLVGASVGAGFAAFESAGYTYTRGTDYLIEVSLLRSAYEGGAINQQHLYSALNQMGDVHGWFTQTIFLRAALSPFMHVVWTALTTAALCRASNSGRIGWRSLRNPRFIGIFALAVGLHMTWNSPFLGEHWIHKSWILGLIAWGAVATMITLGMKQVKALRIAAAAGDSNGLLGASPVARVQHDHQLYYSRGEEAHGPLAFSEILELGDSGVIDDSTLLSDGGDWQPLAWWKGQTDGRGTGSSATKSDLWAWGLVWWPLVVGALVFFLKSLWPLAGFPVILLAMAAVDRAANRGRASGRWPSGWWGIIPPAYLGIRRKPAGEGPGKFVAALVITLLVCGWIGLSVWYLNFTNEGEATQLVNKELARQGKPMQCIDMELVQEVSENVRIFDAQISDGTTTEVRRVTVIRTAGGLQVRLSE